MREHVPSKSFGGGKRRRRDTRIKHAHRHWTPRTTRTNPPRVGATKPSGVVLEHSYDGALLTGMTWSGAVSGRVAFGYKESALRSHLRPAMDAHLRYQTFTRNLEPSSAVGELPGDDRLFNFEFSINVHGGLLLWNQGDRAPTDSASFKSISAAGDIEATPPFLVPLGKIPGSYAKAPTELSQLSTAKQEPGPGNHRSN